MKLFKIIIQHVNHKSRVQTRFSGSFLEKLYSAMDTCGPVLTSSCVCVCVCTQSFSPVQLFATLWTIACQAPVHGILQARILEWIVISFSRGSSQPRDQMRLLDLLHWQVDSFPQSFLPTPFFPPYIYKNMVLFLFFSLIIIMDSRIFPPLNVLEFPWSSLLFLLLNLSQIWPLESPYGWFLCLSNMTPLNLW